ncbi:hypothetical protein Dsin_007399 [Dipteronia sinensis]|uniref:cyclin-dependent kinase n=1 Tax=Dipteronia sinensis TaxID=43782 RepID=A0AAE0B0G4_9ROSI|nr:hypothetical protein Dsin_007399 [Dipteronia sinensis]
MERYHYEHSVGQGSFAVVYKGLDLNNNNTVAIKTITKDASKPDLENMVMREISILETMQHENIVRMLEVHETETDSILIFEYLDQDLKKYMKSNPDLANDPPKIKYEIFGLIGEGRYGKVYRGQVNNEIVAVKQISLLEMEEEGVPGFALREITLLKELQHENIIRLLHQEFTEKEDFWLVFEYLDSDLKTHMESIPDFENDSLMIKKFLHQVLRAISFCHSHKILHQDLKPENLLVNRRTNTLKLANFGTARRIPEGTLTPQVVTLHYRPPEILLGSNHYSTAVDVWSIGCILAEMVNQETLFPGETENDQLIKIFRVRGTPNEENWPGVTSLVGFQLNFPYQDPLDLKTVVPNLEPAGVDLLSEMLCLDPKKRITAENALQHDYFKLDGLLNAHLHCRIKLAETSIKFEKEGTLSNMTTLSILDAIALRYEGELANISVYDYLSIIVPLLKAFLESHLHDLFNKDGKEKSEAAAKELLADEAHEAETKKNNKEGCRTEETDGGEQFQLCQDNASPDTELGDYVDEMTKLITKEGMLDEHLEHESQIENGDKKKCLQEKNDETGESIGENVVEGVYVFNSKHIDDDEYEKRFQTDIEKAVYQSLGHYGLLLSTDAKLVFLLIECEDDMLPDSDDTVSWLIVKKFYLEFVLEMLKKNSNKLTAIETVESMILQEIEKREKSPEYEPQLYMDLLKNRQKKLQEINISFVTSELDDISGVLKEEQVLSSEFDV